MTDFFLGWVCGLPSLGLRCPFGELKLRHGKYTCTFQLLTLNSLSPYSDQHQISPFNIDAYSPPEVMRIGDMITKVNFS